MRYRLFSNLLWPLTIAVALPLLVHAQGGRGGRGAADAAPASSPRASAPLDLTGYWVSIVDEDWRFRMVVPPPRDYEGVPMTPAAVKIADTWDPAKDEASGDLCKAFSAPALLRQPEHLHITWQDDRTLRMDADTGTQTRVFHFGDWKAPAGPPTLQGDSIALWEMARPARGSPPHGSLKVVTSHLKAGYLRKNGVPFSESADLTEYYDVLKEHNGDTMLVVTIVVTDPQYLHEPFIVTSHFKKQDGEAGVETHAVQREMVKEHKMTRNQVGFNVAILLCMGLPALAQIDLSGSWASKNHEDALERGAGPNPGDFTGIPFNEAGRAKALSYKQSQISMPERICAFYSQWHMMIGTFGIKMWNQTDPVSGKTVAWVVGAWEDRDAMTIWMDGRPHPSKNAPHTEAGFTTGVWEGDVLTAYTTHMLTGYLRRNGVMISDQASITTHFIRHGDILTLAAQLEDPIYLTEPYYITRSFVPSPTVINSAGMPCIPGDEGVASGTVPHYLPGENPLTDEMMKLYHIPQEAALGGAETAYPAFRDKIKDKFTIPPTCVRNCAPRN